MEFLLPDLSGVVAAGFLLLVACALILLAALLANTFGHTPVIGGWVKRDLAGWIRDAGNGVLKASKASWHFAAGLFNWTQDILTKPLVYLLNLGVSLYRWINHLYTQALPDLENRVTAYAARLFDRAGADLNHAVAALDGNLVREVANLTARITAVENAAFGAASEAEAHAVSVATGLVGSTVTDLDRTADSVISTVWPDAAGDVQALRGAIGTGFPGVDELLGALGGLGTAGLVGLLIRAVAGTAAVTELATDCIVPNCRNLGQFGQDLENLLAAGSLAALVAWLAAGVSDPGGWAADMQDVAYPLGQRWTAAANGMFGQA